MTSMLITDSTRTYAILPFVIPAQAGIHDRIHFPARPHGPMDSRLRGNDAGEGLIETVLG
jgi:hypothetical protein